LAALIASLPASENRHFREEFEKEKSDVLLTTYLSTLTKSQMILNDLVDKYLVVTDNGRDSQPVASGPRTRRRPEPRLGSRGTLVSFEDVMSMNR